MEARRQDPREVHGILEYRLLESAQQQHNQDVTKMSEAQVDLWKEMLEAVNE